MQVGAQGHLIGLGCRSAAPYMLVSAAILAHPSGLGRAGPFPLHPCRIGLRAFIGTCFAFIGTCFAFIGICFGLSAGLLYLRFVF